MEPKVKYTARNPEDWLDELESDEEDDPAVYLGDQYLMLEDEYTRP